MGLMMQNENTIKLTLMPFNLLSYDGFPAFPWLPIQLGFPPPSHIHAKTNFGKKKA